MKQCRQVIGWPVKPHAWWPELPGKATPEGWDLTHKVEFDEARQCYVWQPPKPIVKRGCKDCGVAVTGITRYCTACAKSRKRANWQRSKANSRSSFHKPAFPNP